MRSARPFCRERVLKCLAFVLAVGASAVAFAQPAGLSRNAPKDAAMLNVFLDCSACDLEYQRQHVTFVSYVRDRGTADLHVLVTTQDTGGGGMAWVVRFIGMGRFQRQDRTFTFATAQRATADDRRKEFARIFRIGLAGYALDTTIAPQLDVDWRSPAQGRSRAGVDPWNSWTFRIGANGNVGGEQSSTVRSYRLAASSSRTTENSKINFLASSSTDKQTFKIDGRTVESQRDAWAVSTLIVKSLGGRAGAGFRASMARSTFTNTDRAVSVAPGIEFDLFPYSESNRRSLTVQYTFGTNYYEYRELTIFDKLRETVPTQGLNVSLGVRAPWGTVGAYSGVSQHVSRRDRYRASISGSTDVSLSKGLSFDMYAQYDKVNDRISLRKSSASSEEILLGLRQLPTDYGYSFSVGVSYSFGSIFSSVVNPRFGG